MKNEATGFGKGILPRELIMKTYCLFIALCVALAFTASAAAQQKPAKTNKAQPPAEAESKDKKSEADAKDKKEADKKDAEAEAKEKKDAELEASLLQQRGLGLIRQAADDAVGLEDRRGAVRVQATAADVLWERDEERARKLFQSAFEMAVSYYRDTKDDNTIRLSPNTATSRPDLRLEVIRLASRHDGTFSRKLTDQYIEEKQREQQEGRLQNSLQNKGDNNPLFGKMDANASELLRTASSLLEVDLKAAIELAQRAFALGVSQSAPSFLPRLAGRNRAATDQIYLVALDRLRNDPMAPPGQLMLLSAYPFGEDRVWVSNGGGTSSYGFQVPPNFTVDEALAQRFLAVAAIVISRAAELDPAQVPEAVAQFGAALFAARMLEPKVAKFQPALLGDWRALEARLSNLAAGKSLDGVDRSLQEVARENQRGASPESVGVLPGSGDRIKELLDRAQQTVDLAQRDDLYQQAAFEADRNGDPKRAIGITDQISDTEYRRKVRSWISFNAATRAMNEKRFDDARRFALDVDATDERAYLFFQIAGAALKEKDRARAVELLDEATQRANAADNTPEKLRALVGIANLFASFDPPRGFEVAADAVRAANKIPNYSLDQPQLVRSLAQRSGHGSHVSNSNVEGFDLGKTLQLLARADFDRALLLAQSLESKPLKLSAVIAVASSVFEKKQMAQAQ